MDIRKKAIEVKNRINNQLPWAVVGNVAAPIGLVHLDTRQVKHALYGKYLRRSTKLHAHDETNACNEGDLVRVAECRPLSKTKNWQVIEVITRAAAE